MMKVSTLFLHGREIWEINSLNYHTPLVQYTTSVNEEEALTYSNFENSLLVNSIERFVQNSGAIGQIYSDKSLSSVENMENAA